MKSIKWGLLSTANINSALIEPIRTSKRSELVAVASRSQVKAAAYAQKWEIPKAYGSYEALLSDATIDVIYNPLPNSMHAEWTIKAAQNGKHVVCEKPLVPTLSEWEAINTAAQENDVTVFEAFMYLHHPQTIEVLRLLKQGIIGSIQVINSWFSFYLPPDQVNNIRLNPTLGGGAFWDVGVYPNSMSIVMADSGAPMIVSAHKIDGETGVDVHMTSQMVFKNSAVAQTVCGFRMPFRQETIITGDGGTITIPEPWKPGINNRDSHIFVETRGEERKDIIVPGIDPYLCEVHTMEACILDGQQPLVPLSLSREFLRTSLAIYESARTLQAIKL